MASPSPTLKRTLLVVALLATLAIASYLMPGFGPRIHDPSTIVQCGDEYWFFTTGAGIPSWHSTDLIHWVAGPRVFNRNYPNWIGSVVRQQRGYFWAPEVIHADGAYWMYYAVSRFGQRTSAIGLVMNKTLDPSAPDYRWIDQGIVVRTTNADNFNAIDPSAMIDTDGRMWMAFGSFWTGIKIIELDPKTKLRKPNTKLYAVASNKQIEAPYIYKHGGYYYLFVNWGLCCRGIQSTYEIRIGRSKTVTGPYRDKNGVDMHAGGGTLLLGTEGHYIGPGQTGIVNEEGKDWISYHYYNGNDRGQSTLGLRELDWDSTGWPIIGSYAGYWVK